MGQVSSCTRSLVEACPGLHWSGPSRQECSRPLLVLGTRRPGMHDLQIGRRTPYTTTRPCQRMSARGTVRSPRRPPTCPSQYRVGTPTSATQSTERVRDRVRELYRLESRTRLSPTQHGERRAGEGSSGATPRVHHVLSFSLPFFTSLEAVGARSQAVDLNRAWSLPGQGPWRVAETAVRVTSGRAVVATGGARRSRRGLLWACWRVPPRHL